MAEMIVMAASDWKAEMASLRVDDPSIENSGTNLKTVAVDYRKDSNDHATAVYFYRTKADAQAAIRLKIKWAELNAREDTEYAESKASEAEWSKKLASLPYMIADRDAGFKLIYDVCRNAGKKDANGGSTCADDSSHDWSDSGGAPYHWFSNMDSCEAAAQFNFGVERTSVSACVPAPELSGHVLRGYKIVFALVAPGAAEDDASYAELRERDSNAPVVFKSFKVGYDAGNAARLKALADLGANEYGNLLGDTAKSIDLTANCIRIY